MENVSNAEFLSALASGMPPEERLICCWFRGDPGDVEHRSWAPHPWRPGKRPPPADANTYVAISSFFRTERDGFRRQTAAFAAGRALMVDDVGTKIHPDSLPDVTPTATIETSPGNFQWWFFLREPERDRVWFDAVIRAFIEQRLMGEDPGMAGVNRVGRLPGGVNGKPKYGGWTCRATHWKPEQQWTLAELVEAFGLRPRRPALGLPRLLSGDVRRERIEHFGRVRDWLRRNGYMLRDQPNLGGWTSVLCPWLEEHSGAGRTGTAIGLPNEENGYHGAFQCHHGHCKDRTWRDLTEFVNNDCAEALEAANAAAPEELGAWTKT